MSELVMAIRRQSQGFTRGSSAFRGVTQHKTGARRHWCGGRVRMVIVSSWQCPSACRCGLRGVS